MRPALLTLALLLGCSKDAARPDSPGLEDDGEDSDEPLPPEPDVYYGPEASCSERLLSEPTGRLVRRPYLQRVTRTEAVVAFATILDIDEAVVRWGTDDAYASEAATSTAEISISDSNLVPLDTSSNAENVQLHHAVLTGLTPGEELCYQVEIAGELVATGLRFRTAPEGVEGPVTFLAIGDFGNGSPEAQAVHDAMLPYVDEAHLFLTMGDNAYGDGDWDELQDQVFALYGDIWAELPAFVTPGNHDYHTDDAAPYLANFFLPENAWKAEDAEEYYSFDWGAMHFIGLNTEDRGYEHLPSDPYDQLDWLEADLEAKNRPWTVVGFHKPAYSGHPDRGFDPVARIQFAPLLQEYGTQLVLQGHDHFYERYHPQKNDLPSTTLDGGVTYIVSGGGGAGLYPTGPEKNQAITVESHHFLLGEIDGCTLRLRAIDTEGELLDDWSTTVCE